MKDVAIKFENISKQYRLGLVSTRTLSHDLNRWWQTSVLRREDPYLKLGEVNDRAQKGEGEYVWALKEITFDVRQGDVLGIVGPNGAGKSTLLKILSRVTAPTTGTIRARGRIASLLEVGTGFHPELTGRENIFMNGSIMGMSRREITRKLDEIVDFAGIARYLDTPVKRYSSGMTVRLGFSIAAHLEPEILVVDEVLAVGDAEFQKKAIGKMQDVSRGQGRTVLFVSHNMTAVKSLCTSGILLRNGCVDYSGEIGEVVDYYIRSQTQKGIINNQWSFEQAPGLGNIRVKSAYIRFEGSRLTVNTPYDMVTEFWCLEDDFPVNVSMHLYDVNNNCVYNISTSNKPLRKGLHRAVFHIPAHLMNDGIYYVNNMFVTRSQCYYNHERAHSFEILEDREASGWHGKWIGAVRPVFIEHDYEFLEPV
ncbi:polysaccharide ABC transporter ATP-binding protein [uncultured Alistipes sp.]|jgi:polysaccharide ABC transporter|uniref:ABC transporter ATP-binding protein n=1 Tax=uncultured Alistipes sp. TaxID=538949 RepID=UPI0025F168D6|nr:polysaccharide ABC transporter ATP-binding protein [uncultured Alistipes sp.]